MGAPKRVETKAKTKLVARPLRERGPVDMEALRKETLKEFPVTRAYLAR